MEKIITVSQADRIKKAEAIYLKRRYNTNISSEKATKQSKKSKFIKKACIQILICSCIFFRSK